MGKARFLHSNLITAASMITPSSLRTGLVSTAVKQGDGSAILNPSGAFSGAADLEYSIEIDSVTGGVSVGQATFKWSDGGGSWDASGVLTSAVDVLLNNGVYINFTAGSGDDFALGDKWWFRAWNLFNAGKMIDGNRDTRYRSSALEAPNTLTINLGSAQEIKALVLGDHNLTSGATIVLKANSSDSWGAPAFSESITWAADKILHYLSAAQTYQCWQIQITDAANPDEYIEIGELFLGSYLELTKNFDLAPDYPITFVEGQESTPYGVERSRFYNWQQSIELSFSNISNADRVSLEGLITGLGSRATGIKTPFWFHEDSAVAGNFWLVNASGMEKRRAQSSNTLWDVGLSLREVLRSV